MRNALVVLCVALLLAACGKGAPSAPVANSPASEAHDHDGGEVGHADHSDEAGGHEGHDHGEEEGEPDFAKIDPATAKDHGIEIGTAAAGVIDESVALTGRLIIDPKRVASIRARFPGPVVAVLKEVGEPVQRGEALARVESNESLTVYDVRSPLGGVVLARTTNVGDVAGGDALFQVGDVQALQAELQAFTATRAPLKIGAAAKILLDERELAGRVVSIAPELEGRTQARRVRVAIDVPPDVQAVAGQFVTGQIASGASAPAAVAVPSDAVRRLENRNVVFIPEETGFRARPVKLGRTGLTQLEILEGLDVGEEYVRAGSFILKAEIGKNLAEHEH